ncbi:hypothetical protein [Paenibacillus sp. NPDC057967]|uniref:hypothetical protein n=1 Tax=Paenibacillus sp. NPDC057967 TaxID=3346293 RepID=UPI0036DD3858
MNTEQLERFAKEHQSFKKAEEGFWEYVNTWRVEEPEEYAEAFEDTDITNCTELLRAKIALVVNYRWDQTIRFVQTTLDVKINNRKVAQYHFCRPLMVKTWMTGLVLQMSITFLEIGTEFIDRCL